jgi:hypothetical protein
MRYLLIKYIQRPNGKIDEEVTVTRRLRTKDIQLCAVILDFAKQEVVQASMRGVTVPKDWLRILGFYYQYYKSTIDRLCQENGLKISQDNPNEKNNPN